MTEEEYIQKYVESIKAYHPGAHVETRRDRSLNNEFDTEVTVYLTDGSRKIMALASNPNNPRQGAREVREDIPDARQKLLDADVSFDDPRYAGYEGEESEEDYVDPQDEPYDNLQPLDEVADEAFGPEDDTDYEVVLNQALAEQRGNAEKRWFDEESRFDREQAEAMPSYEMDYGPDPQYNMKVPEVPGYNLAGHPGMDLTSPRNQRMGSSWPNLGEGRVSPRFGSFNPKDLYDDPSYKYPRKAEQLSEEMTPTQILPLMTQIKRDMYKEKTDNPAYFPEVMERLKKSESGELPFEMSPGEKEEMDRRFQKETEFERYDPEGMEKSRRKLEYLRDISQRQAPAREEEYYA